jgi:light-regulated signal transduction histidine kinase (bacteriophytochrome)
MHSESLTTFVENLKTADNLTEAQLASFLAIIESADKEYHKKSFQLERTLRDKEIAHRLLKASVDNLEITNRQLETQKNQLEKNAIEREKHLIAIENSFQELEQFSYIASHDLKSPLRNIASYAQLLKRRYHGELDEQADEFIKFIVGGVNQMNDVITNLLEYSRIGVQHQRSSTNLEHVLDIVESNLQSEIMATNAKIIRAENFPEITAIHGGMVQLFQNLVSNAIRFRSDAPPVIEIGYQIVKDQWHFNFSDNGIGIDPRYEKKVFQPFQRLHLDRSGTGMGLAICRKIVRKHGGEIWFEPNPEVGTTFHFSVQMADF